MFFFWCFVIQYFIKLSLLAFYQLQILYSLLTSFTASLHLFINLRTNLALRLISKTIALMPFQNIYIIVLIILSRFCKKVIIKLSNSPLTIALVNLLISSFLNYLSCYINIKSLYIIKLVLIDRQFNIILRSRRILQYINA